MSTNRRIHLVDNHLRSLEHHLAMLGQDTSCLDEAARLVRSLVAAKAARREAVPPTQALDLDQVRAMFQALRDRAQELSMPVADVPAIRMAPEDCNGLPVPRGWAGVDLDTVRAVFQARIAQDVARMAQDVARMAQDGSARTEVLPAACGPDDDDDPRPKTREELEAEREALLEELEREAQEELDVFLDRWDRSRKEQADQEAREAWEDARRDAHYP